MDQIKITTQETLKSLGLVVVEDYSDKYSQFYNNKTNSCVSFNFSTDSSGIIMGNVTVFLSEKVIMASMFFADSISKEKRNLMEAFKNAFNESSHIVSACLEVMQSGDMSIRFKLGASYRYSGFSDNLVRDVVEPIMIRVGRIGLHFEEYMAGKYETAKDYLNESDRSLET